MKHEGILSEFNGKMLLTNAWKINNRNPFFVIFEYISYRLPPGRDFFFLRRLDRLDRFSIQQIHPLFHGKNFMYQGFFVRLHRGSPPAHVAMMRQCHNMCLAVDH